MDLHEKRCIPCEGGMPAMGVDEVKKYLKEVPAWSILDTNKKISREFRFKDFMDAMTFVNKVAEVAEHEGHHPDIHIFYNRVAIELWTHAVGGLSENDFILASKIDLL